LYLISGSEDYSIKVYRTVDWFMLRDYKENTSSVKSVKFSPDSKIFASAGFDDIVRIWDPCQEKSIRQLNNNSSALNCIEFSENGKYLAAGYDNQKVIIWEV
jgi:WD40 repeat protein